MTGRILDWRRRFDERSRDYRIRTLIGAPAAIEDRPRSWGIPAIRIDQGREGHCVGFGWTNELLASPRPDPTAPVALAENVAHALFFRARDVDRAAGHWWPDGASVLAGATATRNTGAIDEFRWAMSVEDVRDAVITTGPVVIGIPWLDGMYDTDENGIVKAEGSEVGGHCLLVYGYHPAKRLPGDWAGRHRVFEWLNSWGPSYGREGRGTIHYDDLARLLDGGEACIPLQRHKVRLGYGVA